MSRRILAAITILAWIPGVLAQQAPAPVFDGAKWIWSPPKATETFDTFGAGSVFFRATFDLPADIKIKSADAIITADNLYTLYLNGKSVGESDTDTNAWQRPKRFDIAPLLAPGHNIVAIEAVNTAPGPAGLLCKFIVQTGAPQPVTFVTDGSWRCAEKEEQRWHEIAFDDKNWRPALPVADFGAPPWGRVRVREPRAQAGPAAGKVRAAGRQARLETAAAAPAATIRSAEAAPPADYSWPEAIAYVGDDCSLYRTPAGTGTSYDSLNVTIFNPRHARAYPEHDLPAPMKVGHKLCILKPARPGAAPRVLVDAGKGALGSPSVSFDGSCIYVSMARENEPFFHIYRVPLDGAPPQRLTDGPFHDIDPAELPDGRIVFTSTRAGTFEEYHSPPSRALFVMNANGRDIHPITSTIIFDNQPAITADGRIIFIRSDNFFDRGKVETMLHAIHPDGREGYTEFGLYNAPEYGGRLRAFVCGCPSPLPDGRVAFVSSWGISVASPGAAMKDWQHIRVEAGDVAAMPDGRLLTTLASRFPVEVKAGQQTRVVQDVRYLKIAVVDQQGASASIYPLFQSADTPLHSPVFLGARPRPPVLADQVNRKLADDPRATGVFFCQNVRFTQNTTAGWPHARAIRVLASKGLTMRSSHSYLVHAGNETVELGTVPLAPDGSFAVEVPADTPIAFQAVDAEGRSELNEMSWIYVRPGERRGCLGCHQSRQAAPPTSTATVQAMSCAPLKLTMREQSHRFRGNNPAVTGLMELQFDRFREVAGLNRHTVVADPQATSSTEAAALCANLKSNDENLKISSAQRLAIFRDPASAQALAGALRDDSREVRVQAAMALASSGTRDSVPPLLEALNDPEPLVAQAAAVAIENLTAHAEPFDPFGPAEQAAAQAQGWKDWFAKNPWSQIEQDLIQRLSNADRDIVRRAAVALGHTGSPAASQPLRAYAERERSKNPLPEWRASHHGDGARFNSVDAVNPRTLQAAFRSIGYLKDAAAVPMLADTVATYGKPESGNLFIAEAAIEALGRIGAPDAEAALIDAFNKFRDYPTCSGWYGDHSALIACHASPLHYLAIEALDAIGSTRCGPIVPALIRSVPTDTDRALFPVSDDCETLTGRVIRRSGRSDEVIETCLAILGDAGAKSSKEIADAIGVVHGAWGGRPDPENRSAQMLSLICRDRKYEPRLRAAFDRYRAKTTDIKRVFDKGIPVVRELPVKHWVCFFLARTLGNVADSASAPSLLAALEQSAPEGATGYPDPQGPGVLFLHNDLTPCWRAEAAWALARIGHAPAVPALLKTVANLTNAPDTRHAAAEALERLANADQLDAIRKLAADYPEVSTRRVLLRVAAKLSAAPTVSSRN